MVCFVTYRSVISFLFCVVYFSSNFVCLYPRQWNITTWFTPSDSRRSFGGAERIQRIQLLIVYTILQQHDSGLTTSPYCLPHWPRGLRRTSAAARLLRLWVRIPPGAWMSVCCECCVLSGRGLCDELITHPEESYRLWCVLVCVV